jgi:hypothetical protein
MKSRASTLKKKMHNRFWRGHILNNLATSLSHGDIMRVQKIITLHQDDLKPNEKGYYRGMAGNNVNVTVGGRLAPDIHMCQT